MATGWFFSAERQAPREQAFANLLLACISRSGDPTSLLPDFCLQACGLGESGYLHADTASQLWHLYLAQAPGVRAQQGLDPLLALQKSQGTSLSASVLCSTARSAAHPVCTQPVLWPCTAERRSIPSVPGSAACSA